MIYGERIRLRAIEREDIPLFVLWLNDPEVRLGIARYLPISMVEEARWFENVQTRPQEERPLTIEIQEEGYWRAIGNQGFFNIDWRVRSAEVGIFIGEKAYWNQGYGTEAMRLMLQHGFETLNFNRIYLTVNVDNPRAVRSYEKVGFILEGQQRQATYHQGAYSDQLMMSVLREEYSPKKRPGITKLRVD